jgi:HEAT repeats
MRAGLAGLVVAFSLLAESPDVPRDVLNKAIQARGGEKQLAQVKAVQVRVKGKIYRDKVPIPFVASILSQLPDQYKHVMDYEREGEPLTQIQVYSGKEVWLRVRGELQVLDAQLTDALQRGRYAERLTQLGVLKDKAYELTALGDSKLDDRDVAGILVTSAKKTPVKLFFDKKTGLLAKTEHRQLDPQTLEEVTQETYYNDYQIPDTTAVDQAILKKAQINPDGPALIERLRKLKADGIDPGKIRTLIRQLGDDSFEAREKATQALIAIGEAAAPFLQQAIKSTDLEVARRAQRCLAAIHKDPAERQGEDAVWIAVIRTLARKRPEGASDALLSFLSHAASPEVEREARFALGLLARSNGESDPVLVKALEDKDPRRRQAATEALGRSPAAPGSRLGLPEVNYPMKGATFRDGRKFMDWEVVEVVFLNKIDDKEFIKP